MVSRSHDNEKIDSEGKGDMYAADSEIMVTLVTLNNHITQLELKYNELIRRLHPIMSPDEDKTEGEYQGYHLNAPLAKDIQQMYLRLHYMNNSMDSIIKRLEI